MTDPTVPAAVDRFFETTLLTQDEALADALARSAEAGLAPHAVSPAQGAFLQILARAIGAARILEIGTLGGYSTIWLARALPAGGSLVSLEADPACVATARANIEAAGLADRVTIREGAAVDGLDAMIARHADPFDFVFIDADKPNNPAYLERCLLLSRPGTLIVGDNVVRNGAVADAESDDANVQGVRRFLEMTGADGRLTATALQTVGAKGYDGFSIALVG